MTERSDDRDVQRMTEVLAKLPHRAAYQIGLLLVQWGENGVEWLDKLVSNGTGATSPLAQSGLLAEWQPGDGTLCLLDICQHGDRRLGCYFLCIHPRRLASNFARGSC